MDPNEDDIAAKVDAILHQIVARTIATIDQLMDGVEVGPDGQAKTKEGANVDPAEVALTRQILEVYKDRPFNEGMHLLGASTTKVLITVFGSIFFNLSMGPGQKRLAIEQATETFCDDLLMKVKMTLPTLSNLQSPKKADAEAKAEAKTEAKVDLAREEVRGHA